MPSSKTNPTLWMTLIFAAGLVALVLYLGRASTPPQPAQPADPANADQTSTPHEPASGSARQDTTPPVAGATPVQISQPVVELAQGRPIHEPSEPVSQPTAEDTKPPARELTLVEAAQAGDVARLRTILSAGADVNARDADGTTLLMRAAGNGHLEAVFVLLDFGADPSIKDADEMTAADHAAVYPQIVQVLSGASVPVTEPDPTK